jgi:hypothetical protein
MGPKSEVNVNVFNQSDKVTILNLLNDDMPRADTGWHHGKNDSSIHSIEDKELEVKSSFL